MCPKPPTRAHSNEKRRDAYKRKSRVDPETWLHSRSFSFSRKITNEHNVTQEMNLGYKGETSLKGHTRFKPVPSSDKATAFNLLTVNS